MSISTNVIIINLPIKYMKKGWKRKLVTEPDIFKFIKSTDLDEKIKKNLKIRAS